MKRLLILVLPMLAAACGLLDSEKPGKPKIEDERLQSLAKMFAELPLGSDHLQEVHDAVEASSGRGYDEEYTMECLLNAPGSGVGETRETKGNSTGGSYGNPLRNLIRSYFQSHSSSSFTKSSVDDMMGQLAASGYQLYWPFSDSWDGESFPVITFDPGFGAESNYGYAISFLEDGTRVVDSVYVDEQVAMERPVWVLNRNSDAGFSPVDLFDAVSILTKSGNRPETQPAGSGHRRLMMKSFKMLRQFDTWFRGASEFNVKCGSVEGFTASTEAELKLYSPSVTDFTIVVKRKYVNKTLPFDVILVSDFSTQLDKIAFLVTEDDGGTRTNWKCQAQVKFQSKTYGFDVDLPYNEKDDIVWRGQLSARFFEEEDIVSGRFGDVVIDFELE